MTTHLYDRKFVPGDDDAPALIAARIRAGSRVLDIGTGAGALGKYLTQEKSCTVDGVTYNPAEAEAAKAFYRRVVVGDLERSLPSSWFAGNEYDYVVCADVLEHLRTCDEVLADLGHLLAPDGRILVSVPNVTYVGVLASLLVGRVARTREGLLDATHIRFFDRQAISDLAETAGMSLSRLDRVMRQPCETEFRYLEFESLPPAQKALLTSAPEALVYEYVLELVPEEGGRLPANPDLPGYSPIALLPGYESQVYFDYGAGFSEEDSARSVSMNTGPVEVVLQGRSASCLHALRLDFVDRPGLFELHEARLILGSRGACWQWHGDWSSLLELSSLEILAERGVFGGRLMMATTDDPILVVRFDPPLELDGELPTVCLKLTGPQEYARQAFSWAREKFVEELAASRQALVQSLEIQNRLGANAAVMEQTLIHAETDKEHLRQYIECLKREVVAVQEQIESLKNSETQIKAGLEGQIERLRTDLAAEREAHHVLIVSPFRLLYARLQWLFAKLKRYRS